MNLHHETTFDSAKANRLQLNDITSIDAMIWQLFNFMKWYNLIYGFALFDLLRVSLRVFVFYDIFDSLHLKIDLRKVKL